MSPAAEKRHTETVLLSSMQKYLDEKSEVDMVSLGQWVACWSYDISH